MCLFLKMKSKLGWNNWIYKWGFKLPVVTVPVMTNIKYGYLYNWYAVTDVRNITNTGWHVPTKTELETMLNYIDTEIPGYGWLEASNKLREIGTSYWNSPNTGATNELGFNAKGSGGRLSIGYHVELGDICSITVSDNYSANYSYYLSIREDVVYSITTASKKQGASIRLLKDLTTLTHGQTGTYTGNDGKVYRTICIGTQEWLADNLAETKYRNGDIIQTVTDTSTWYALTSGAKCAYNNDESNVLN
jgi:uncharacterized protein (TIGR02145 family)